MINNFIPILFASIFFLFLSNIWQRSIYLLIIFLILWCALIGSFLFPISEGLSTLEYIKIVMEFSLGSSIVNAIFIMKYVLKEYTWKNFSYEKFNEKVKKENKYTVYEYIVNGFLIIFLISVCYLIYYKYFV